MRIVIVDDQPLILAILREQLEAIDNAAEVATFTGGSEALAEIARAAPPVDFVFCDLNMPGMDGVQFVRHLAGGGFKGGLVLMSIEDRRILDAAASLARAHDLRLVAALQKPLRTADVRRLLSSVPASARAQGGPAISAESLRRALEGDQLVNHYQPKVHLADGSLAGVECLVRWQHPEQGLVYPDAFIALAEENDLIDDLTLVVLRTALRDMKAWMEMGLQTRVAVNLSMDSLAHVEFADRVAREVEEAGVPVSLITLEVTESRLMNNRVAALEVLTRLRLKRFELYIDDFGTGHSSLAQLRDIPFSGLKIDRNFVHGACRDPALSAIVGASLEMAKKLGMRSVAEGVEDQEDWQFLLASGCDLAQGYFIAKPFAAEALPGWSAARERRPGALGPRP